MPVDLTKPLRWKSANADEHAMLTDLQGNILKGHGRRATQNIFIRFGDDANKARAFVRAVGKLTTSALDQLKDAETFKKTHQPGPTFVTMLLSHAGYDRLGATQSAPQPADGGAFAQGMVARGAGLHDPAVAHLEPAFQQRADALVIVADDPDGPDLWTSAKVDSLATKIANLLSGAGTVLVSQPGRAIFRKEASPRSEGIEHFGYVDGRSQPLLLAEQLEEESLFSDGITVWDPTFPLSQVLVPDPGSTAGKGFGSFFVFRKLEQNVKAFKDAEAALGATLGTGEQAGATIVGRYEDGTSIMLQASDGADDPVMNNFEYSADRDGARCPLHAHIRKTNPRGDSVRLLGATLAQERAHIMARRGITYGHRDKVTDPSDAPTKDVGLLFMSYQANLRDQFEFTQGSWANNPGFPRAGTGIDPIIGQPGKAALKHNKVWGHPEQGTTAGTFGGHVTLRGGEYFFAPARSTLAAM